MDRTEWIRQFKLRTKKFAIDVMRFCASLPRLQHFWVISGQLIRCATSVPANYRASCRVQSKAAFLAKMNIVEEEADESEFWLEVLGDLISGPNAELNRLFKEAGEILAITIASRKTASRTQS